uniref:Beta-lactamase-related domain-containing protein n=1 Tax=Vitrella brassicaformis TaxID=1169539 RepID=A0A7S1K0E1_9ALVE
MGRDEGGRSIALVSNGIAKAAAALFSLHLDDIGALFESKDENDSKREEWEHGPFSATGGIFGQLASMTEIVTDPSMLNAQRVRASPPPALGVYASARALASLLSAMTWHDLRGRGLFSTLDSDSRRRLLVAKASEDSVLFGRRCFSEGLEVLRVGDPSPSACTPSPPAARGGLGLGQQRSPSPSFPLPSESIRRWADGRSEAVGYQSFGGSFAVSYPQENVSIVVLVNHLSLEQRVRKEVMGVVCEEMGLRQPVCLDHSLTSVLGMGLGWS